jgi:flagellar biosynthesis anti-sigma factor FlgM
VKINESDVLNIAKPQSERLSESLKLTSGPGRAPSTASSSSSDQIDLGSQAGLLSQAQNAGSSDRQARVEQLRALVQSGQYQVDPAALSKSIVNAALNGN